MVVDYIANNMEISLKQMAPYLNLNGAKYNEY